MGFKKRKAPSVHWMDPVELRPYCEAGLKQKFPILAPQMVVDRTKSTCAKCASRWRSE